MDGLKRSPLPKRQRAEPWAVALRGHSFQSTNHDLHEHPTAHQRCTA